MADTRRTWSALATLLATNAAGAISAQDLRDFLASAQPHEATADPAATDDGTNGYDTGHLWWNSSGETLHVCVDNTTAAAVWVQVYPVAADLSGVDLADGGSGTAALGQVLTADGSGGAAWEDAASGGGMAVSINAQTGTTYTLVLGDAGKLVTLDNSSAITLTVPTNASVAFPAGTVVALAQLGAGLVTVAGATGVTVNGTTPGDEDLAGQWSTATLTKLNDDEWLLSGGLAA